MCSNAQTYVFQKQALAHTRCRFLGVFTRLPFFEQERKARVRAFFLKEKPGKGTYALQIFRCPYQAFLKKNACSFFCKRKSGKGTYALQTFRCPYQTFPCEKTSAHAPLFKKDKPGKGTYALQIFIRPFF